MSMAFCSLSTFVSVSLTRSSSSLTTLRLANVRTVRLATSAAATPKPATTTGKREPRGITKPKPISPAMQELLGVTEIPRTQALKQIWAYIKQHNLQDPENKKIIVCDEKLKKIFAGKERVGFLEISGLLNPHFIK
ncbi:SWIB/MDM2 domain superfamily protein [Thalictrum thalictroides]|uniref:SWIB/MDM2 domain superfamily protein n=1 Tax=Thalictrum thalictroides TaxID=46969 RepID=A0A7J6X2J2_THATH|nr:SWIB/MDM2 domain superfamily protein [Thalictrum thalictroides]